MEAAQTAKQKAEEQVAALKQSHKAEMEAEKSHYEALLQKARSAQVRILPCSPEGGWQKASVAVYSLYNISVA